MEEEVTSAPGIPLEMGLPSSHIKQPLWVPREAELCWQAGPISVILVLHPVGAHQQVSP